MKKAEKSKPTKKKILMYYVILAACLLIVAAITVGVIYGVYMNTVTPPDVSLDGNNPTTPPDDDPDDNPPDGPNQGANASFELIVPVKDVNLTQAHVFAWDETLKRYALHEGMDFSCSAGTQILAAENGKVTEISTSDQLFGAIVTIEHANKVKTVYKYIDPLNTLKVGDEVTKGAVIGTVAAATGNEIEMGDHLHFEVFENNVMKDPDSYLNIISK